MEEKCPYVRGKMATNFLGSPNSMDFAAFSHAMENWWGNPCISHITKHTMECESNFKKAPILSEKYEYRFPRFSTYDGFCNIFPEINFLGLSHSMGFPSISHASGNWRENPGISHMVKYATGWQSNGKNHTFYGKNMGTNFPGIPHSMGFICYGEFDGKTHPFPMWWSTPQDGNLMEKSTHTVWKVWVPISQVLHIRWVL